MTWFKWHRPASDNTKVAPVVQVSHSLTLSLSRIAVIAVVVVVAVLNVVAAVKSTCLTKQWMKLVSQPQDHHIAASNQPKSERKHLVMTPHQKDLLLADTMGTCWLADTRERPHHRDLLTPERLADLLPPERDHTIETCWHQRDLLTCWHHGFETC